MMKEIFSNVVEDVSLAFSKTQNMIREKVLNAFSPIKKTLVSIRKVVITRVKYGEEVVFTTSTAPTSIDESRLTRLLGVEKEEVCDGLSVTNFCKDLLLVEFSSFERDDESEAIINSSSRLFISEEGEVFTYNNLLKVFCGIDSHRIIKESEVKSSEIFSTLFMSASQARKQTITLIREEAIGDVYSFVLGLTDGAIKLDGSVKTQKEVAKLSDRLSLSFTPTMDFGSTKCIAFINRKEGKFDGSFYIKEGFVEKLIPHPVKMAGFSIQSRIGGIGKGLGAVLQDSHIDTFIDFKKSEGRKEVRLQGVVDVSEVLEKANNGDIVIVGEGTPDLIADLNVVKLLPVTNGELGFGIVNISKSNGGSLNSQVLPKIDPNDRKNILLNLFEKEVDRKIDGLTREASISDVQEGFISDVIPKIGKEYMNMCPDTYSHVLKKALKGEAKNIKKLKARIKDSGLFYVLPDFSAEFGVNLIRKDEVYSNKLNNNGICDVVAIKYPSMGTREFLKLKVVGPITIMKRVNKLLASWKIDDPIAQMLIDVFLSKDYGTVMVAADESLMKALAGMDFDGDEIHLIWDKDICKGIKQDPIYVNITD